MAQRSPNHRLILVEWEDSCSKGGVWNSPMELTGLPATCFSVGWIVKETRKALVLASSAALTSSDGFDSVAGDITIPRACIVRRKTLARGRL